MHTQEDLRHKELLEFFHHKNKFRSNTGIPVVKFNVKFELSRTESFWCCDFACLHISLLDDADFLACVDRMGLKPLSLDPPAFEVANL